MTSKTLLVMAGGTGGHIYPALSVADYLAGKGWDIVWLGTKQGLEKSLIPKAGYKIEWLDIKGVRGKSIKQIILAPFHILLSCIQALKVLLKVKPDAVLGMGGFVSVPGGLMSALLGKPLIIHEQNAVAGTANNILRFCAKKVLFSFEGTFKKSNKYQLVGNPVRKEIAMLDKKNSKSTDELNILVLGGSLGAQTLNKTVPKALALLTDDISVQHQCGEKHLEVARASYADANVEADVIPFIKDMHAVYDWADIAICRAGAMTVAELAISGVPAIFIPYPYAIDDHQTLNAKAVVDAGGAILIPEKDINAESLAGAIRRMTNDKNTIKTMSEIIQKAARPSAVQDIAEICVQESCS